GLSVDLMLHPIPLELPGSHELEVLVVALGLPLLGLVLLPEMTTAGLLTEQGVAAHELAELQEVRDAPRLLEALVQLFAGARHVQVLPELLADPRDLLQRLLEARLVAGHAALVPDELAQLPVEGIRAPLALNGEELVDARLHRVDDRAHLRVGV